MAKEFKARRKGTKVTTGEVRLSYAHLLEPKAIEDGQTPKYSVSIIIPKDDKETLRAIKEAIEEAKEAGKGKLGGKIPANLKTPVRDGDEDRPDDEAYANSYFINANSTQKPRVLEFIKFTTDGKVKADPIDSTDDVYSGMYGCVSLNFYAYNTSGNKGIAAGLGNVLKTQDGDRLGGGSSVEDDFDLAEDDGDFEF
ncbi:DUF2815 family protein [Proteiniclasticum sp. BAD-10]|uniref:DUF2815 family protein n=1 Tax=Proteiniclasticum sediminis TaxID=2804028 RepID=A0A941CN75_9CLOT|nr:DUF2815 family protein [Proteiniclasticum sediminis]MBR0575707.1 DUF2815 family protein [Proteiniclasticum sediminis]